MAAQVSTQSTGGKELEIVFKANGESASIFISDSDLRTLNKNSAVQIMADKIACALCCYGKAGFGACMARCLVDGQCCDGGVSNCTSV